MKGWDHVLRIGLGYDVHRLHTGRQLVLGGVIIPYPQGFQAYSDGDPVAHAIVDALLGTISPGEDIANRFPDTDPRNKTKIFAVSGISNGYGRFLRMPKPSFSIWIW